MTKHFTKITDLTKEELQEVLDLSVKLQNNKKKHVQEIADKNVLFCFEKPSLRTLVGTESAINQLGGSVIHSVPEVFLGGNIMYSEQGNNFGERESFIDTIKNVQEFCDAIFTRVFSHETIKNLAKISDIPVINALCDKHHPMQAIADMLTIQEIAGKENKDICINFIGDANNVAFSLFQISLILGYKCNWTGPEKYNFSEEAITSLKNLEKKYGGEINFTNNPIESIKKADFVYADAFVSMGEENQHDAKTTDFANYQINHDLWAHAKQYAKFMHCLPAHRNIEVTDAIIDGPQSVVYQQAKNRMVTAKGLFAFLLT